MKPLMVNPGGCVASWRQVSPIFASTAAPSPRVWKDQSVMSDFEIQPSQRLLRLPPYLFARINALKHKKRQEGIDIIDLGMGNPSDPTPQPIVDKLCEAVQDPRNQRYSVSKGVFNLRRDVARHYSAQYGVEVDPETEVVACIGSKEGISHLLLAMLGPGDTAVVGDPAFPIHVYGVALAGANVISVPLGNDEAFLERIRYVVQHLYPRPKLLILNYPHNPTAMTVDSPFYEKAVALAKEFGVAVLHDFAYGETCFDGYKAPSFLSAEGAKDVGVEFTTMSKPYNMAGWRIGMAVGNAEVIRLLASYKSQIDNSIFTPIMDAGALALTGDQSWLVERNLIYQERRDVIYDGLVEAGFEVEKPKAALYLWARLPGKFGDPMQFCADVLNETGVSLTPGVIYGPSGKDYIRISIITPTPQIKDAMKRLVDWVKAN